MNKIIQIALSTKFSEEIINTLIEVLHATPNPEHATSLLLGVYEEPKISTFKIMRNSNCVFKSYDPWHDSVIYSYFEEKGIDMYVSASSNTSLINKDNYLDYKIPYSDKAMSFRVLTGETVERKDSSTLERWENATSHSVDIFAMQA